MTVHRTLNGGWAECADSACTLKFHFPDMSVEAAAGMPMTVLLPLLEIMDPPNMVGQMWRAWHDADGAVHRDYDLPAIIWFDGRLDWYQHDSQQRAGGKPSRVYTKGTRGLSPEYWRKVLLLT